MAEGAQFLSTTRIASADLFEALKVLGADIRGMKFHELTIQRDDGAIWVGFSEEDLACINQDSRSELIEILGELPQSLIYFERTHDSTSLIMLRDCLRLLFARWPSSLVIVKNDFLGPQNYVPAVDIWIEQQEGFLH